MSHPLPPLSASTPPRYLLPPQPVSTILIFAKPVPQTPSREEEKNTPKANENPKYKSKSIAKNGALAGNRLDKGRRNCEDNNLWKGFEKYKNLPKLPLVKDRALEVWHVDDAELEEKVIGGAEGKKRIEFRNVEESKSLVEKKREMGKRLLSQYVQDYESSRG